MSKVSCSVCGVMILARTAMRNEGKCVPCSHGTREAMEARRRWYKEERERDQTDPGRIYWRNLINRVYQDASGFSGLSEPEKKYFAVSCLDGDVYRGGFESYFGGSGVHLSYALTGLAEMKATTALDLVLKAKQVLFDFEEVPDDMETRERLLRQRASHSRSAQAERLDELYYKDQDSIADKLEEFAREHRLF